LGEPSTPLFSITDFISFEVNQVRAFDTAGTPFVGSSQASHCLPVGCISWCRDQSARCIPIRQKSQPTPSTAGVKCLFRLRGPMHVTLASPTQAECLTAV